MPDRRDGRGGEWMRRVWFQVGDVSRYEDLRAGELAAVTRADAALAKAPDSRDRHRALVIALARAGDLARAEQVARAWIGRDRLDAEALTYLADVVGRQGRRDEALRLLAGVVDLDPDGVKAQERLAAAYERIGAAQPACAHRIAIAERREWKPTAAAVRCERALGREAGAARLLAALPDAGARARAEQLASVVAEVKAARGTLVVDATWSGDVDVDVSLITPQGVRLSWMGGRTTVRVEDASATDHERLALSSIATGGYVLEVARTDSDDDQPITGQLRVTLLGKTRLLPFTISGDRATVGRVDVRRDSRLVPM